MPENFSVSELLDLQQRGLLTDDILDALPQEEIRRLAEETAALKFNMRQQEQIAFYRPVSERALQVHLATEKQVICCGGNRSSKTTTALADLIICMTKVVPFSLQGIYPQSKIQCPMRARIVCESLTSTWEPVIKPKLVWNRWNGRSEPGGEFGHWGLVPRRFLIRGKWEESFSEKLRTLTLTCGCTIQIMSYDQDLGDFSGSSLHRVIEDEPPSSDIHRENLMRTIDTAGQVYSVFTPPDDPGKAIRASWIYEVYERGVVGPGKDPDIKSIELYTEENRILLPEEIEKVAKDLTPAQRETRLHGAFIHLQGRIYPLYTDRVKQYCVKCNDIAIGKMDERQKRVCVACGAEIIDFIHFIEPEERYCRYPIVFLIDPHPRRPNLMIWIAIDPYDDHCQIHELEVDGDPEMVRDQVLAWERDNRVNVVTRLIDANMALSPAHSAGRRHVTVRDEFDAVGLRCALADDAVDVGIKRIRSMLKPDPKTKVPRMRVFNTCKKTNYQFLHFAWQEWSSRSSDDREVKEQAQNKHDDAPALWRYAANANFTYSGLQTGRVPMHATRPRSNRPKIEDRSWMR